MPCVTPLVPSLPASPDLDVSLPAIPAESIPLHLPSSLPQHLLKLPELASVKEKEYRLRLAQADDALAKIRWQRRIISGLWQFKKLNVDGTRNRSTTRMRALYNKFNLRTQRCAACYRAARNALLALDPDGSWQSRLKHLSDNDICGPGKDDSEPGNSRFEPSWIWLVPRVRCTPKMGDSEELLNDSLQVEWAKVWARKQRWEEEVLLIQEEMRRVVKFHEWKSHWWRSQAGRQQSGADISILHGAKVYAEKQSYVCECLAYSCVMSWWPELKDDDILLDWDMHYSLPAVDDVRRVVVSQMDKDGDFDLDNDSTDELDEEECDADQYSSVENNLFTELLELDD